MDPGNVPIATLKIEQLQLPFSMLRRWVAIFHRIYILIKINFANFHLEPTAFEKKFFGHCSHYCRSICQFFSSI